MYNYDTLKGWWRVTFANGRVLELPQTDIGPHPRTGRIIDILYSAMEQAGYGKTPREWDTITDTHVTADYLGKRPMSWRPAKCITAMLEEANRLAPHRDKSSDGIIGDAAHASSQSDHNPDSRGIVHAIDLTQAPKSGWDCAVRSEQIRVAKDRRVLYVIFNHRWFHGNRGGQWGHTPWAWEPYRGSSPHEEHMHVSVEYGDTFENDVRPWWGVEEEEELKLKLIQVKGKPEVYITDGVDRGHIPNPTIFKRMGFKSSDIEQIQANDPLMTLPLRNTKT